MRRAPGPSRGRIGESEPIDIHAHLGERPCARAGRRTVADQTALAEGGDAESRWARLALSAATTGGGLSSVRRLVRVLAGTRTRAPVGVRRRLAATLIVGCLPFTFTWSHVRPAGSPGRSPSSSEIVTRSPSRSSPATSSRRRACLTVSPNRSAVGPASGRTFAATLRSTMSRRIA
ncbi:hypothetical protein N868_02165 [Cellulomonas carbonis T26]|uniref:Uncharacterized protein n=1 Tax=Cellulomonas carbonis T26 TaxID=947969 RepID=A0A0A0BQP3_9CELL|nr:hypothetical protein N868_02165 [Cellulomonas carbonis T26]